MRLHGPAFYDDMVSYAPTARIYRKNSDVAARRVHEMIDEGIRAGAFRDVDGNFAAQVVAITIDAVQSGALLQSTGLSAGDAFSRLGDLILDGLSLPATSEQSLMLPRESGKASERAAPGVATRRKPGAAPWPCAGSAAAPARTPPSPGRTPPG